MEIVLQRLITGQALEIGDSSCDTVAQYLSYYTLQPNITEEEAERTYEQDEGVECCVAISPEFNDLL